MDEKPATALVLQRVVLWTALALMAVTGVADHYFGNGFYLDVMTRVTCLAIAAVGLNLIVGYGGLVSFGHAAYIGLGAYCVGIPSYYGVYDAGVHFPLAIAVSSLFALITGALSLRTRGVYFIMITMAFAQMVFFAFVSLEEFGGDDGLVIDSRSQFGGGLNIENNLYLFGLCYLSLLFFMFVVHRMTRSRFGLALRGAMGNERRMRAIGHHVYGYRLTAYVISGAICGYAGALLGNFTGFISPEMMDWTRSGELLFMVVLGGVGTTGGPVLGAIAILVLEELFSSWTVYWHLLFGALLVVTVLFGRGGINGLLEKIARRS